MTKRLGCLHSHYSNIEYIEKAFSGYELELVHFVDPGLMHRVSHHGDFHPAEAEEKVREQLQWIASCDVDAILITCTNYIALLKDEQLDVSIPVIKIDEPYFEYICSVDEPQLILFTNPATVKGTMDRLTQYGKARGKKLNADSAIIDDTFELMMQGKKEEYKQKVASSLKTYLKETSKLISVAQLSMVDGANQVEEETGKKITQPLDTLTEAVLKQFNMK